MPKTADAFLAEKPTAEDFLGTPTGLPSINEPTDATPPPQQADLGEFSSGLNSPAATGKPGAFTPQDAATASAVYSPALKYGGAMVGATLGLPAAAAAGPLAPAVEAAAGAGGFAIGASLKDQLDQMIGLEKAPENVSEIAKRTAGNIAEGAQTELLGRNIGVGVEAGLNLAAGGAAAAVAKGPEYLNALSQKAANLGINLTPAELIGSKGLSAMESILDNLPWTSGIVQKYRLGELQKLNTMRDKMIAENGAGKDIEELGLKIKGLADSYMQKLGTVNKEAMGAMKDRLLQKVGSNSSYEDLDISAKQAVAEYQKQLNQKVSDAYNGIGKKVDAIIGPDGSEPGNLIEAANRVIKEQESVFPGARNNDLLKTAKAITTSTSDVPPDFLQAYQSANPQIKAQIEEQFPGISNPSIAKTYSDLDSNVKAWNIKKYSQIDPNYQMSNAGRQWDTLIDAAKTDMNSMAAATGDADLAQAHQIADRLYKQKLALFEDPAFKTINKQYPGAVSKTVLESGNPELISRYKDLVGDELFNKTKDRLTNDILGLDKEVLTGDDIRKNVVGLGKKAGQTIYSPTELDYFQKLSNAIDLRAGATNELLKNPYLKKMVGPSSELAPSGIARAVIRPNNAGAASAVETMLGADAKKKIADAFLPELLSTNQNGDFMPQTFAKQFHTYGKDTIRAWYGKDFADKLESLADVTGKMGGAEKLAGNPSGTARHMIAFYEGQRIIGKGIHAIASGFSTPALLSFGPDAAMILGSRQLAKLYTSPAGRSLFVDGLITPIGSKAAGELTGKILSIIGNEISNRRKQ